MHKKKKLTIQHIYEGTKSGQRMDSGHGRMRMNVESDRLSSLPDDLIHKILSFVNIREAIGTCVLSPRWRFIWTSLPYLDFSTLDLSIEGFYKLPKLSKFVTNVLSRRNNSTDVYSMKLRIRVKKSLLFVKRIMKYAFSHNIQHLDVVFELEDSSDSLLSLFSSQPIKHLSLTMQFDPGHRYCFNSCFASTSGLQTLTTLDLSYVNPDNVDKCFVFISKCANLKNLTLKDFNRLRSRSNGLSIFHPRLSNLTLEHIRFGGVVNIDAPQLKNLTIRSCDAKFVISAPVLVSLLYKGYGPLPLSTEGFHSLEKADICFPYIEDADIHGIVSLLQLLQNVKFLTLNMGIVELLSLSKDLILQQPSPFVNLKSLKIFPEAIRSFVKSKKARKKVTTMSTKVKSYLLGGSAGSTLTMVLSEEEVRAQKLMDEILVCLEKDKDIFEICRAHLEQGKTPEESHGPKKLETGENMAQIQSDWKDLFEQFQRRVENVSLIMSKLDSIQELTKLPGSDWAKIRPFISNVYAEVHMITASMRIQREEFQSRLERVVSRS